MPNQKLSLSYLKNLFLKENIKEIDSKYLQNLQKSKLILSSTYYGSLPEKYKTIPVQKICESRKIFKNIFPIQPKDPKFLKVAIIGLPSSGKSLIANKLLGRDVLPVTGRDFATNRNITISTTEHNKQLEIIDSPGIKPFDTSKNSNLLVRNLAMEPWKAVASANLTLVCVDSSQIYDLMKNGRKDLYWVFKRLNPSASNVLLLNKIDLIKEGEEILFEFIEKEIKSKFNIFEKVFRISAIKNYGIKEIRNYLNSKCRPGEWKYHHEQNIVLSDSDRAALILEEKFLISKMIPYWVTYNLKYKIISWTILPDNSERIDFNVICKRQKDMELILSRNILKSIGDAAERHLSQEFNRNIRLVFQIVNH